MSIPILKKRSGGDESKSIKEPSTISSTITLILGTALLFLESIYILFSIFRKGLFKKEILSETSTLGFDIEIIEK